MELPDELLNMLGSMPETDDVVEPEPQKPLPALRVEKDKRKGKTATLITGYDGECDEVTALAKLLKQQLAVGGSSRDGEILLQGDVREKAAAVLREKGYKVRVI